MTDDLISRQYAIKHYQHVCRRTNCKECPLHIQVTDTLTDCELELFLHNLPSAQQYIRCPEHINQFTFSQIQYENTFCGKDCEIAKAYGDCFHCFASSISKRDKEIEKSARCN